MSNEEKKEQSRRLDLRSEDVRRWATSREGQLRIAESFKRARELTVELSNARRIDPKKLDEPITL